MVRETRYLLIGNLPESTTENEIAEYFKRYGKIQKVKLERKPEDKESDDKDDGSGSCLTATVAFTDIKSASNAHKADKKVGGNLLSSEYSEGFGATGSVVKRTHEPEIFPRTTGSTGFSSNRKGLEEEADGFDVYYGPTPQFNEPSYPSPNQFTERGRPRERWTPGTSTYQGHGGKWTGGTSRPPYVDSSSKDGFEKPKTSSIPASSPTHSTSQSSEKRHRKKNSKSVDHSRSSSRSSRSSSSSSDSGSASSSKERPKSAVASAVPARSDSQSVDDKPEAEIEPGEREPLGILITKLPLRSSDTSLRDGLFHEYKKYGKITAVQISGVAETRYAVISFKQSEDASKALEASKDKRFFGTQICVIQHEGIEVEDSEFCTPEAQLDEHSPKATRTLFLGNLEKEITIDEIKEKLDKYGEILDVDVKRQGAVSAYAFIQFSDITSVVRALKDLDGTSWGSTKLKVGFGKSMATPVIWLDNLADTVNEGFLCRQFSRFGGISHTVVDRVKNRALIFFMNIESAQYALPEMRNRIWNGKKIHIDFASRDCQEAFFLKMEGSGQLRPGERPDQRWMHKQIQNDPYWDENMDITNTATPATPPAISPATKPSTYSQGVFTRGRSRFQRGRGYFRGRGGSFEGGHYSEEATTPGRRNKQVDEYSQGSGAYMEDDSFEQELREYGHSQRERRERSSQSPPGYEDMYYEGSQTGREYETYEKHPARYESYRSLSPSSDREVEVEEEYKYKTRTPSVERYYYKDKYYEESKSRDRSHSSDSEQRFRLSSEIAIRRTSRSRSPTAKHKRTKELPISYRSQSPPTPTDDEPAYYHGSGDHSPTDFDSAFRKYDYKKRLSSGSIDGDKKLLLTTGLRKEIESKSEERSSRKRSYDQMSPKRGDSVHRLERQISKGSRSGSVYDFDKASLKDSLSKIARLKSEVHERVMGKDSPSSGSSVSDVDPSTMSEAELAKLHRKKQTLLDKLTLLEDTGNNSEGDSNGDTRHVVSKKARMDLNSQSRYLAKSDSLTKQQIKERLKMIEMKQNRKADATRKKELLREIKKSKSSDSKKELLEYSEDESQLLHSPRDYPAGFMPKKRRKMEMEMERKVRSYRSHQNDDDQYSSEDEHEKQDSIQRQISSHSEMYSRSRTGSSMDARIESELFSHGRDESRRISSGSDTNKDLSEHGNRHRRHKHKKDDHITPLIPLGDDEMPDPETSDPRVPKERLISPMLLPLPDFAQFIQFSPLPSPHCSPEHYSDLSADNRDKLPESATGTSNQPYQSPCFSPQSSSSKTHSPSESPPSGSGSEVKVNANSDSGDVPLGFPTETEQIDPLEETKKDSLETAAAPPKTTATESKEEHDSLSDNNSDAEPCNLSSENLSIEERIRRLDEKWNQSQAVMAATPKVIPAVESLVNTSLSSSSLASSISSSVFSSLSVASPITTTASPTVSSIYSKYRIRKKNETSVGAERSEPSEIAQTILSKSSIFDQDSKRLGQIHDSMNNSKDITGGSDNSPKVFNSWDKTNDANKELPMVTVPGSLMDRLGQSQNMSFPTLTVNNSFTNNTSVPTSNKSEVNLYPSDPRLSRLSPSLNNYNATNFRNKYEDSDVTPSVQSEKTETKENMFSDKLDMKQSVCDVKKELFSESKQDVGNSITDRTNNLSAGDSSKCESSNGKSSSDVKPNVDSAFMLNDVKKEDPLLTHVDVKIEKDLVDKVNHSAERLGEKSDKKEESTGAIESKMDTSVSRVTVSELTVNHKNEECDKSFVKPELSDSSSSKDKTSKTNTNSSADSSNWSATNNTAKRKADDTKSDSDVDSKSVKVEPTAQSSTVAENKCEPEITKEPVKTEVKSSSEKSTSEKEKHANKESSKSEKEPSCKKQKTSSKDKHSESGHKDEKHKKKESDKKSESSHKSSSEKKDEKKDKHKSKSEKEKKDSDKKVKEEKKESKDDKKKKSEKKEKKEDKKESKEGKDEKKEKDKSEGSEKKEKDKSEKKDKDKHEKKEGHKHEKIKSPDKKAKMSSHNKDAESKDTSKESTSKDGASTDNNPSEDSQKSAEKDKDKSDKDKEKSEKKKSDQSNKKEHKSSSSHKAKKSKDEDSEKKSKESKKSKDDHAEHKKKDDSHNRNNKDSPDKNKDSEKKETSEEKKEKSSEKSKESTGDKCKEHKSKDKENKDKDPDVSKSKGKHGSNDSDKNRHQSGDKTKSDDKPDEKKADSQKDDKKSKDSDATKSSSSSSSSKSKEKSDSQKKGSDKSSKSSKNKCNEVKSESKSKPDKEKKESKEKDGGTPRKKECDKIVENGLTEEDMAIFAQFAEPYMSMYDKVKRRSTDKQIRTQQEQRVQKSLLHEYKRSAKTNNKKQSLSDITESSDMSSDEEKRKLKTKKTFSFSSNESESSSGDDILRKKSKSQLKKPKRILDIYSSDSEEEERQVVTPSKKISSNKKKNSSEKLSKPIFDFDSISDSDNKTSSTKQARSKTAPKTNKNKSKTKSDTKRPDSKDVTKPNKPKTKDFLKDLFSDDSDDSLNSDSDSGSDILISAKNKKKSELKKAEKKTLPKGSSIYTTSEESDTDDDFKPLSPPRNISLPKALDKKGFESDHLTSDADIAPVKKKNKNNRKINDSFDSDNLMSDPESFKLHKTAKIMDEIKAIEKINNDTILFGEERDKKLHKAKKQKSKDKDKSYKDSEKNKINKMLPDIFSDSEQKLIKNLSSLEMTDVFHSTLYEKDKLPFNLTNKDNLPPILSDIRKEPLLKLDVDTVRNDIPSLKDINGEEKKSGKSKSKKQKKENKKKKKNKEKPEKEKDTFKERSETLKTTPKSKSEHSLDSDDSKIEKIENVKPESESDVNFNGNSATRNLFDDMKSIKSPNEGKKKKKKADQEKEDKPDLFSDSDFLSDSEKKKDQRKESLEKHNTALKSPIRTDIFDFREDEDSSFKPIKESHVKKADSYDHNVDTEKDEDESHVPIDVQDVEIEYQSEDHDATNTCPDVETSEVVIEQTSEEKTEKPKSKQRKKKSQKAEAPSADITVEAVTSLEKEHKPSEDIQTEVVPLESPVSNEQLVIDEGVSLHVEDETNKAVDSIVNEIDETALAVESILFDSVPAPFISEPVEPTPQLDQNYLQPEFGLPSNVPQVGTEVETTTASTPVKAKKGGRKSRKKSGQGDSLSAHDSSRDTSLDSKNTSGAGSKAYDLFEDSSTGASFVSDPLHDQNDDDDDGRLQIDFDPPKEQKQKKQRKPKQTKANKLTDAAALAAENKLDNLFGSFEKQKEVDEVNRDSISSENSELERSKHEDLLVMDREDQRQDSDMMSPDERSTSDDLTSPLDGTKVKTKRGRKPKAKDPNSMPIPRTNSPRSTRTQSPRSPRSVDPRSPKFDILDPKTALVGKGLTNDEALDKVTKSLTNVFDFDDTDETSSTSQVPVTKQRKPRRKKGETMQSPEHLHMFSPERKQEDKLVIGSPGSKVFNSPEHKGLPNNIFDKKTENLLSPLQPEEVKADVKTALDDKPPEPLFKAFFEGKKSEKDAERLNCVRKGIGADAKLTSPQHSSQLMSNVDKTIDDVAKGLFESTDDEACATDQLPQQKKRQSRKSKDEEASIKSPVPKSPMVKSPLPKSPMGKSPMLNNLHSPPPVSHHPPLALPGMGQQPQIGEPQLAGHVPPVSSVAAAVAVTSPLGITTTTVTTTQAPHVSLSPVLETGILSPKASGMLSPRTPVMMSPKALNESPVKTLQSSPLKNVPQTSSVITTVADSCASTTVSASTASVVSDPKKTDAPGEALKASVPGFIIPGVSVPSTVPSVPAVSGAVGDLPTTSSLADIQKKQMEKLQEQQQLLLQKQQLEQQKINEQKQAELQKQQEHHVKLKEQELKQKELERQKQIAEQHAKLQAQIQEREELEKLKKEQRKKQLQEQHKLLQQQYEQLTRQAAIQASQPAGQVPQQPLLSPGSMPRPSLPTSDGQTATRPPLSAHHPMPQGTHFGLPGQHPMRPQLPPHLAQGPINPMHLVQPLAHDKPPSRDELALKHQQLQHQIAQQKAAQAQALAEQQAQLAKQQAQQAQAQAKQQAQQATGSKPPVAPAAPVTPVSKAGPPAQQQTPKKTPPEIQVPKSTPTVQGPPMNRKDILLQRPPLNHNQPGIPGPHKEGMMPGSQESANQLSAQIKQIAMSQQGHMPPNMPQPLAGGPHPIPGWSMPAMPGPRPDGPPRQPGLQPQVPGPIEGRVSMPGPVPALGGNPQSVQRVSPHPPTKSPTVAQTAPNMTLGFSQHQTAAPRAPSPAVAKTAERPTPAGGKWSGSPGSQRPGQSEVRPRAPATSDTGPSSRPEPWTTGINGPTTPGHPMGMTPLPRPAHQQPPSAHQQQPEHTLQLTRPPAPGELSAKDKFMQQQIQAEMQRRDELQRQEMQRQQQLREQALNAQAQKEVQIHKERERAESLEREKLEREARGNLTSQSPSDSRQAQVLQRAMVGYPFVEPRPPSRDSSKVPQSPVMVDPRFAQQYPGPPHPTDLRMGPTQTSAFSPAAGSSSDAAHMYTQAELQRLQQNGLLPSYPPGLRILEPHMIAAGHAPPYMIPGHLAYQMAQLEQQQHHLVDGRPPSRGTSRPPSNQPVHTVSPTQTTAENRQQQQNRQNPSGQIIPARDPHPGDGSLLSLLQRYPVMWQGVMELKSEQCVVQMHFISGFQPLVKMSLPQQVADGTVQPLRIAQRMRLEQTQLEGVAKRMQVDKDYCMMLALPCGRDHTDIYQQTRTMSTGFIQYLQQKHAAGIVNVADPGSQQAAYVVHIFPPCDFSQNTLSRLGFDLLYQVKDLAHLIVIIATVG